MRNYRWNDDGRWINVDVEKNELMSSALMLQVEEAAAAKADRERRDAEREARDKKMGRVPTEKKDVEDVK